MFFKNHGTGDTKAVNFMDLIIDENTDTFSIGYYTFCTIKLIPTKLHKGNLFTETLDMP